YRAYAADPQMRLNIGIRRRLAPLVENSRRRVELLNMLLLSLPGTPVIYYGDELGMGDNIYLGDRNGVRTPMQWTSDRNAGFSRADPARLYAPPIMDPVYGYQAVNVEAQERSPFSLLNWMKRMIAVRKQHQVFGRGAIRFLPVDNRKVLAYARSDGRETVIAVANLSRTLQPALLDLAAFRGLVPVEMLGRTEFPRVGDAPYFLTLAPYASYWFELVANPTPLTVRPAPAAADKPEERAPLLAGTAWDTLLDGHVRVLIERDYLPAFLHAQRWFGGKARTTRRTRIADWALVRGGSEPAFLALVEVEYESGPSDCYFVPMALRSGSAAETLMAEAPSTVIARLTGARRGVVYEGARSEGIAELLLSLVGGGRNIGTKHGSVRGVATDAYVRWRGTNEERRATPRVTTLGGEQSNTSLVFSNQLVLKLFRRIEPGPNPDVEVEEQLAGRLGSPILPPLFGVLRWERRNGERADVAILEPLVANQGTAWDQALHEVGRFLERASGLETPVGGFGPLQATGQPPPPAVVEAIGPYLQYAHRLGTRSAEMHLALAADHDAGDFAPVPLTTEDAAEASGRMTAHAGDVLVQLEQLFDRLPSAAAGHARAVLAARETVLGRLRHVGAAGGTVQKIRVHGDYHLGQVLLSQADYVIIDFEGEPARPLAERRAKQCALKDVAGMMRSFSYAAMAGLHSFAASSSSELDRLLPWARVWQGWSAAMFLNGYIESVGDAPFVPRDRSVLDALLSAFLLDKAMYELGYELNHRPEWVPIPLSGIVDLIHTGPAA
ncbi:MAG: putative maltokinase, partial [Bacteroidales bacterium]